MNDKEFPCCSGEVMVVCKGCIERIIKERDEASSEVKRLSEINSEVEMLKSDLNSTYREIQLPKHGSNEEVEFIKINTYIKTLQEMRVAFGDMNVVNEKQSLTSATLNLNKKEKVIKSITDLIVDMIELSGAMS